MNDLAVNALAQLLRTTLFLSVAVALVWLACRLASVRSPRWRRLLAVLAVLQGIVWFQIPLAVPWYPPQESATALDVPRTIDEEPVLGAAAGVPADSPLYREPVALDQVAAPRNIGTWPLAILALWIGGLVIVPGIGMFRYLRFVRRLPPSQPIDSQWAAEWQEARSHMRVSGQIDLVVTESLGPLLCWTPRGSRLLVPRILWSELSSAQRRSVLLHELAHFNRHDLLKSLLVRALALPHWFNPFAWLAVREFDEAGEWLCDDRATEALSATEYAKTLLKFCERPVPRAWPTTAARGSGVAARIHRLISLQTKEDSTVKKLILALGAALLFMISATRIEFVAQAAPESDSKSEQVTAASPEHAAKQQAMVAEAERTYEATSAHFNVGYGTPDELYVWSNRWRLAATRAANNQQQREIAYQEHLDRMKQLQASVKALYDANAKGGEPAKYFATRFYVAEAELLLLEAKERDRPSGGN
jgi:beta-lactamase regulating signal transducer with metallopeptidase domain